MLIFLDNLRHVLTRILIMVFFLYFKKSNFYILNLHIRDAGPKKILFHKKLFKKVVSHRGVLIVILRLPLSQFGRAISTFPQAF